MNFFKNFIDFRERVVEYSSFGYGVGSGILLSLIFIELTKNVDFRWIMLYFLVSAFFTKYQHGKLPLK